jgi:hypothetical protein
VALFVSHVIDPVSPADGTLQLGHVAFDELPERFAYLLLNERQEAEVDEAELILRPETPPSFCPIDRVRFEGSEVVLKETLNVICGNALPIFRRLSSLLPPLKRILKTNED